MDAQRHTPTNAVAVKVLVDEGLDSASATKGEEVPIHVAEAVTLKR
jgi:hypothetical protein